MPAQIETKPSELRCHFFVTWDGRASCLCACLDIHSCISTQTFQWAQTLLGDSCAKIKSAPSVA